MKARRSLGATRWRWLAIVAVLAVTALALRTGCAPEHDSVEVGAGNNGATAVAPEDGSHESRPRVRVDGEPPAATDSEPAPITSGTIRGSVILADGTPAPGARVLAESAADEEERLFVSADEHGAFRFDDVPAEAWNVTAIGGGFGTRLDRGEEPVRAEVVAGRETVVEVIAQALATITGRVTDTDGEPVPRATIEVWSDAFWSPRGGAGNVSVETDEEGRFSAKNVAPGDYTRMEVRARGLAEGRYEIRDVRPGAVIEQNVMLESAALLTLQLLDDTDGSPVVEAYVWVYDAASGETFNGPKGDAWVPDAAGRVPIDSIRSDPVIVTVNATDYVDPGRMTVDPTAQDGELTIRLVRGRTISGIVRRADGSPAAGQHVTATQSLDPWAVAFGSRSFCISDSEGRFAMAGLAAGRWIVGIFDSSVEPIVTVEADAGADHVVLVLPASGFPRKVTVRAVDSDGRPVARVRARDGIMFDGSMGSNAGGVLGDAERDIGLREHGDAFVEFWDARDSAGNRLPLGHVFAIVPKDAPDEWTVTLPPEQVVTGRALLPDGTPAATARVQVATVPVTSMNADVSQFLGETAVDRDGMFTVRGLGTGRVWLRPWLNGYVADPVQAGGGDTDVVLRLRPEAPCTIRLLDEDGQPVPGIRIWFSNAYFPEVSREEAARRHIDEELSSDVPWPPHSDESGQIVLHGLHPARPYRLSVRARETRGDLLDWDDLQWAAADATIVLARAFTLSGRVVAVSGAAPETWTGDVEARRDDEWLASTSLQPDGSFEFEALPRGCVTLEATTGEWGVAFDSPPPEEAEPALRGSTDAETGTTGVRIEMHPTER